MKNRVKEPVRRLRITDWPEDERPREKMLANGAESLTSAELLAIMIRTGSGKHTAVDLAKALLNKFVSLEALAAASVAELLTIPGIGTAKAVTLKAAFELSRKMQREIAGKEFQKFRSPEDVARVFIPEIGHLKKEVFCIALLDNANKLIHTERISVGTLNASLVHPREVFNPAIKHSAASIILVHNHPSGQLDASREDLNITRKLVDAGKMVDIPVRDHIIIAGENFRSFMQEGWLNFN